MGFLRRGGGAPGRSQGDQRVAAVTGSGAVLYFTQQSILSVSCRRRWLRSDSVPSGSGNSQKLLVRSASRLATSPPAAPRPAPHGGAPRLYPSRPPRRPTRPAARLHPRVFKRTPPETGCRRRPSGTAAPRRPRAGDPTVTRCDPGATPRLPAVGSPTVSTRRRPRAPAGAVSRWDITIRRRRGGLGCSAPDLTPVGCSGAVHIASG